MQNFASREMLMVCSNWTTPMYTIIKYKHSYLFIMLIIVTFVYVHSQKKKSMIFTKNVFLKMPNSGKNCVSKYKHLKKTSILPELMG